MENVVGNRIRERRLELGLSQKAFARKLGVDHSTVSAWEKGVAEPRVFTAICLAQAFETTVEELFSP